jgi:hypothetical protein
METQMKAGVSKLEGSHSLLKHFLMSTMPVNRCCAPPFLLVTFSQKLRGTSSLTKWAMHSGSFFTQAADRTDATNLMWPETDENADPGSTCHLNVWQWRRLDFLFPQ